MIQDAPQIQLAAAPQLLLPRDEMAFRKQYQDLLIARAITTVFRPGDRVYPAPRGYRRGERVTARVIETPGSDALGVPPTFNAVSAPIMIREVKRLRLDALRPNDFRGSSPDVRDRESLLAHLLEIYGPPLERFGGIVTRIRFRYVPDRFSFAHFHRPRAANQR